MRRVKEIAFYWHFSQVSVICNKPPSCCCRTTWGQSLIDNKWSILAQYFSLQSIGWHTVYKHTLVTYCSSPWLTHPRWWSSVRPGPSAGRPARGCAWSTAHSGWCRCGSVTSWGKIQPSPLLSGRTPPPLRCPPHCAWKAGRWEERFNKKQIPVQIILVIHGCSICCSLLKLQDAKWSRYESWTFQCTTFHHSTVIGWLPASWSWLVTSTKIIMESMCIL